MMEDVFESALEDDDLEKEADEEVDKVLWELTAGEKHFYIILFLFIVK